MSPRPYWWWADILRWSSFPERVRASETPPSYWQDERTAESITQSFALEILCKFTLDKQTETMTDFMRTWMDTSSTYSDQALIWTRLIHLSMTDSPELDWFTWNLTYSPDHDWFTRTRLINLNSTDSCENNWFTWIWLIDLAEHNRFTWIRLINLN